MDTGTQGFKCRLSPFEVLLFTLVSVHALKKFERPKACIKMISAQI